MAHPPIAADLFSQDFFRRGPEALPLPTLAAGVLALFSSKFILSILMYVASRTRPKILIVLSIIMPTLTEAQFIALRQSVRADAQRKLSNHVCADPEKLAFRHDPSSVTPRYLEVWFKRLIDGAPLYVKIVDVPNQLSGDIVRGKVAFPTLATHTEISGNDSLHIPPIPLPVDIPLSEIIPEDVSAELATLPLVAYDERVHFAKLPKFRRELQNLIKCRGASPYLIEILGRTEDGQIVFPRFYTMLGMMTFDITYALFRRWALQLADALCYLHSVGIVHRDFALRNVMCSPDLQHLVVIDLESRYGSSSAPELALIWRKDPNSDPDTLPYTEKTDVFMFGMALTHIFLGRVHWHFWDLEVPLPAPFDEIIDRCMSICVDERPTIAEAKAMIEGIGIPGRLYKFLPRSATCGPNNMFSVIDEDLPRLKTSSRAYDT